MCIFRKSELNDVDLIRFMKHSNHTLNGTISMTNFQQVIRTGFEQACITFREKHNIRRLSRHCDVNRLTHKLNSNSDGYMTFTDLIKVTRLLVVELYPIYDSFDIISNTYYRKVNRF